MCCSVFAMCCSAYKFQDERMCVAVSCSVLQCVAVSCRVLQCVATWCSVLQQFVATAMNCRPMNSQKKYINKRLAALHVRRETFDTVTHCNTLQHTETHCNTLQHAATHCNALKKQATSCAADSPSRSRGSWCVCLLTLQHTATHCNTLQHTATHRTTLHHDGRQDLEQAGESVF